MQEGARTGWYSDAGDMNLQCKSVHKQHYLQYYPYSAHIGYATTLSLPILTSLCTEVAGARSLVVLK